MAFMEAPSDLRETFLKACNPPPSWALWDSWRVQANHWISPKLYAGGRQNGGGCLTMAFLLKIIMKGRWQIAAGGQICEGMANLDIYCRVGLCVGYMARFFCVGANTAYRFP